MSEENKSEISILKNSINLALGDESVIAEFERQFLEHDTSIFKNWERSRLEQFAALQYLRAYFRKATLMLLLKQTKQHIKLTYSELKTLESQLEIFHSNKIGLAKLIENYEEMITFLKEEMKTRTALKRKNAKKAANARHSQKGGYRDKKAEIIEIWMSGKYKTRNQCARYECKKLKISEKTARNYLVNTSKSTPLQCTGDS